MQIVVDLHLYSMLKVINAIQLLFSDFVFSTKLFCNCLDILINYIYIAHIIEK